VSTNHISGTADRLMHCQLSSPVSVINVWWSSTTVDHTHRRDLYSAARPSKRNGWIAIWCHTEYLACVETLRRAGVSAAAKTVVTKSGHYPGVKSNGLSCFGLHRSNRPQFHSSSMTLMKRCSTTHSTMNNTFCTHCCLNEFILTTRRHDRSFATRTDKKDY